jgi:predicted nuclease of restriction endonuclease-like (RecB) superfamily
MKKAPRGPPEMLGAAGTPTTAEDALFARVVSILEEARSRVARAVNSEMILAYWHIGREIVEEVQRGAERAQYGEGVIRRLAERLTERYGRGFSKRNLEYIRAFYIAFSDRRPEIVQSGIAQSDAADLGQIAQGDIARSGEALAAAIELRATGGFRAELSWGHYRVLSGVDHAAARLFYEAEAVFARWSVDELERQVHTHLFMRLYKSRGNAGVADLIERGAVVETATDVLRAPYVLDFLGLPDGVPLHESKLESAIIAHIQHFLLELGKGFAFVARQRRLQYDDQYLYVDLVFYNCILKCYVLIDLKMGKFTAQDVGQMDSYVRLFDDQYTTEGDNPTIGLILCTERNEAVARYSVLHGSEQIFAARYVTWLPTVEELQAEIRRERLLIESGREP